MLSWSSSCHSKTHFTNSFYNGNTVWLPYKPLEHTFVVLSLHLLRALEGVKKYLVNDRKKCLGVRHRASQNSVAEVKSEGRGHLLEENGGGDAKQRTDQGGQRQECTAWSFGDLSKTRRKAKWRPDFWTMCRNTVAILQIETASGKLAFFADFFWKRKPKACWSHKNSRWVKPCVCQQCRTRQIDAKHTAKGGEARSNRVFAQVFWSFDLGNICGFWLFCVYLHCFPQRFQFLLGVFSWKNLGASPPRTNFFVKIVVVFLDVLTKKLNISESGCS